MIRKLAIMVLCLLPLMPLAACQTSYNPGSASSGFRDTQLSPTSWQISVSGNMFTGYMRVEEMTLLRAAEIVLRHGGSAFHIEQSNTNADDRVLRTGGYWAGNTYIPADKTHYAYYDTIMVVEMAQPGAQGAYDAQAIARDYGPDYGYSGPTSPVGRSPLEAPNPNPPQK